MTIEPEEEITAQENRRLRKEVKELHARVVALESSRWWRLHPRFLLKRLTPRSARDREPEAAPSAGDAEQNETVTRFREEIVARGSFSEDWFTVHIPAWERVLPVLEGRGSRLLELGSFEGLAACFLLWRLPDAHVTCVDTFAGRPEWQAYGISASELEGTFDRNVALVDSARVRKLVGKTHRLLPGLVDGGEQFDLIYVDASHRALDAIVDAALSWQLLAPRGVAIFDDYGSIPLGEDVMSRPTVAIDALLGIVAGQFEVLDRERQLIIRKSL